MNKRMTKEERKVSVKFIDNTKIHYHKLAEFFARKISERGIEK